MGCCSCLTSKMAECIMQLVSSLLMTLGIILAAFGAILQFGGNALYKLMSSALSSFASSDIGGSQTQLQISDLQSILGAWAIIISYAGWIVLGLGFLLFGVGLLGCVGACCGSKPLLLVYIAITLGMALTLTALILAYNFYKREAKEIGRTEMKSLVIANYQGSTGSSKNQFSTIFDFVQARVGCCGVDNHTDFNEATKWNRTYNYTQDGYSAIITLNYGPVACCKLKTTDFTPKDANCTFAPTTTNSNWNKPCYEEIWTMLDDFSYYAIYSLTVMAIITGILAGLAFLMLRHHVKADVTPL